MFEFCKDIGTTLEQSWGIINNSGGLFFEWSLNGLWLAGSIQNLAVQRMSRCKKYVVGVVLTWVKACSLRAMDTLNIKGLQHSMLLYCWIQTSRLLTNLLEENSRRSSGEREAIR